MTEFPQMDSGLAVPVFTQGDDPIACLNKAMAFLTAVASLRFPSTNNQLRTSSNPRNQATIQDDRVTVQQFQGMQGQSYVGTYYKGNATSYGGNNVGGQVRVVKCYNCQGEGHMAKQCNQPKKPRNAAWFKEKAILAEAQESDQILDEEQLAFLADPGISDGQATQTTIPNTAVLMANISNYGSDIISEVPYFEPYHTDMDNQSVHAMQELSDEQAFWLQTSHPNTDQSTLSPVKIKAPKELPKVSLVNTSLKKLKYHLGQFDTVVKKRITPDAITEGEWGIFENDDSKAHLQAKDTTICKLKEHIKSMRENNKEEKVKHDMDEIETINIELKHRIFKLDLDPLAPRLLKNIDAHIDYLKYTQKQADILWGIVKQAKAKQPLDNALEFAYVPSSSSLVNERLSRLFSGIWTPNAQNI
ncbi:retrovirus-related pol polyprotein from transposon TNT 1-94 [Tanacetum coccineum]